ncbi:MAG: nickel-dependent hydrogenase large subunit [Chloroflexi bacterium]|nr:nickel-dependent hydrogenase large subunit [Chloroflexota bacterium]
MCFKNLPVEFDADGKPFLREDVGNPYALDGAPATNGGPTTLTRDKIEELLERNGHIEQKNFDPVTRVAGALAFHTVVDTTAKKVMDARSVATLFRGYEVIMMGRDPRDAIFITSRACGVCGGVHSTTSALAIEMACGVKPPPLGTVMRNLLLAIEYLYDNPLHLFLLAGPDYSEAIVSKTNPELFRRAEQTHAPHSNVHGYSTIADIMRDLNPLEGSLYLEALGMTRVAREAYVLIGGKYPHPQTIVPGGISATVSLSTLNEIYIRIQKFFDYGKRVAAIYDDICDFFYDADPRYRDVGRTSANLIDLGQWDDPDAYDATYENAGAWGERRWATPGVIIDGKQVTTNLQHINLGLEEFVDHSFYEDWAGDGVRHKTDPLGAPLSPYHPWNKSTRPRPGATNWREKYTWATSPRWDRQAMDAEASARLWNTAVAQKIPSNPYIEATGHSLKMLVPAGRLPEMELEWHVPDVWNAFERNRGRAYCVSYTSMVALNLWSKASELMKAGQSAVSTKFEVPKKGGQLGVGFWGAGRGYLSHHLELDSGVVTNYQIITPSTINASPRDAWDTPGKYEEAVLNTPILETGAGAYQGIDVLRAIRSFDPCMPCTTHIHSDAGVVTREINTCACGVD